MKSAAAGTVSGCVVWMIVFGVLSFMCLPIALVGAPVGSMTIESSPGFVADILGPYFCPKDSTAEIVTRATTIVDSSGVRRPATAHEMQCVDSNGNVVREPSPDFLFVWVGIWLGIFAVAELILSALIAFLLAAPAGVLIVSLSNRLRKANTR